MLIQSRSLKECVYRTETYCGQQATWRLLDNQLGVMCVRIPDNTDEAYRMYAPALREPMPGAEPGFISFDPAGYPDLSKARVWLPEYAHLWDEVAAEYRSVIGTPRKRENGCAEGRGLVLQRHSCSGEWVAAASVMGESGLVLSASSESGPGPDMVGP
ncbi:hypothetical protein, partial [Nocardia seriolae]